jgi:hypothetical protein
LTAADDHGLDALGGSGPCITLFDEVDLLSHLALPCLGSLFVTTLRNKDTSAHRADPPSADTPAHG